jgi:hypothetical protein
MGMLVSLLLSLLLHAADTNSDSGNLAPPADASTSAIDPKAQALIEAVGKYYAGLSSFQVDLASTMKVEMKSMKTEMASTYAAGMSRPNSFALILQSGILGETIISDGKKSIIYMPILRQYTFKDAPTHLDKVLDPDPVTSAMMTGGLPFGLNQLLASDPAQAYLEHASKVVFIGPDKVGDAAAQHVQVTQDNYITDLWFADGPSPLLLQAEVKLDMTAMQAALKKLPTATQPKMPPGFPDIASVKTERLNVFTNWKVNQAVPASFFVFQPPPDAKLVSSFLPPQTADKSLLPSPPSTQSPPANQVAEPAPASVVVPSASKNETD